MFLTLRDSKGQPQSIEDWVKDIRPEDQRALYNALAPHVEANEPANPEKFRRDFCNLAKEDKQSFIKMILESNDIARNGMLELEIDAALQAELKARKEKK